jgi:phosphoglycerate dehydrogenase-like enzyme
MKMKVIACENFPNLEFVRQNGIELVSFDDLLARSDYLSLHCPHCDETHHIINEATLAKMKKGSTLINTARGKLVDERALLAALKNGHLRGRPRRFEEEPPSKDNPLLPGERCPDPTPGRQRLAVAGKHGDRVRPEHRHALSEPLAGRGSGE